MVEKGQKRECIRSLQDLRKAQSSISVTQLVDATLPSWPERYTKEIKDRVRVRELTVGEPSVRAV